jgi:hypothetical protein
LKFAFNSFLATARQRYEKLINLFLKRHSKTAFRNLSKRFDEEIPKRKTNCLSPATAGRVFVFPEFRSLTRQISVSLDFLRSLPMVGTGFFYQEKSWKPEVFQFGLVSPA